jgi:hypothetical protein
MKCDKSHRESVVQTMAEKLLFESPKWKFILILASLLLFKTGI